MTSIYRETFDQMAEGLSPPTGIVPNSAGPYIPANCEVDDVHCGSTPHSTYLKHGAQFGFCHRDQAGGFTDDIIEYWIYIPTLARTYYFPVQDTVGDFISANILSYVCLRDDNKIKYHDGDGFVDTGQSYTVGPHILKRVHDIVADTFDLYWDGVKIVNGGANYNDGKTVIKNVQWGMSAVGGTSLWFDDVHLGEWTGLINSVTNPSEIDGIDVADISVINGV